MQTTLDVVNTVGYYSIFPALVITPAAIAIVLMTTGALSVLLS